MNQTLKTNVFFLFSLQPHVHVLIVCTKYYKCTHNIVINITTATNDISFTDISTTVHVYTILLLLHVFLKMFDNDLYKDQIPTDNSDRLTAGGSLAVCACVSHFLLLLLKRRHFE